MAKKKYPYNLQRLLLTALVAVSFFGFILWAIQQEDLQSLLDNTNLSTAQNQTENQVIKIVSPKPGSTIKSPVTVAGEASVFEALLKVRIKDAKGLVLAEQKVLTAEGQKMSPFSTQIKYKKPTSKNGLVEFFAPSAKDGSELYKISIPITFKD